MTKRLLFFPLLCLLFTFKASALSLPPEPLSLPDAPVTNELSPEEFANLKSKNHPLYYINKRSDAASCGLSLGVQEKVRQQALKEFADQMRQQGIHEGDLTILQKKILSAEWKSFLEMLILKPTLAIHTKLMFHLRDEAWRWQEEYYAFHKGFKGFDDEADAYRHFIFSVFLVLKLDLKTARYILDAHEWGQRDLGSMMDLYNNHVAVEMALKNLNEWRDLTWSELETELTRLAGEMIHEGRLVVIDPVLKDTPQPSAEFYAYGHQILQKPLP